MEANMSKSLQWIIGAGVVLITAVVVISAILPLLAAGLGWTGGYGMMGAGQAHMPMMGQAGAYGMLGGFGMPFMGIGMFLWPLALVGLSVLGVVWVARTVQTPRTPQPPPVTAACAHCGKLVQAGWKACPHCGEKI